ncbi:MAG: glycoside hydrolase family 31 protein [Bacteroidetes bacterium]|nr:glycoside hydrolase family 31 protein [Bacteroidota bacterium]
MTSLSSETKLSRNSFRNQALGKVTEWHPSSDGLQGRSAFAFFKLTVYSEGIVRVQASRFSSFEPNPYTVIVEPKNTPFEIEDFGKQVELTTNLMRVRLHLETFSLSFFDTQGKLLNEDDSLGICWLGTEVSSYKKIQKNEKFLGLGEKTGNLDRAGNAYTHWNKDYFGYGVNDDPLYMSIPFYLGVHDKGCYGIFFDNTHKTLVNFGASTNRFVYFSAEDGDMDYYFFHQPKLEKIISDYTWLTGRMQMPPKWSLGFQQCRYSYYPESEVHSVAKTFRDKHIPADVIYLDIHHMEAYKVFTFDGEKFPNPKAMISRLKEKGFKVVVILDPGIKVEKGYLPYEEGVAQHLFVTYPDGELYQAQVWPGWCAFPDFTKEKARDWWAEKMKFYTEAGVDGFWTDMNEPASWGQCTPNLLEFDFDQEGASHRKARNIYGLQVARSTQEGAYRGLDNKRPFVLTRSGFAGIQRYAAAWTGDNTSSEEHMLAGVRLVTSLGLSGVSFAGVDVGGFAGEASKGLFARWMSIGAFSPLCRAHSMINTKDAEPWTFGEEVEEISRNYLKLRYSLLPTLYSKIYSSTQTGLPVAASLALSYSQDETIYQQAFQNQYLFCQVFLVAPIESFKEITKVYLPEGEWYYLYSDQKFSGNQVIYQDCPLNYLPVYVKAGGIFTQQSVVMHTESPHDGLLRVHLYRGKQDAEFLHFEDEGEGLDYLQGAFFSRKFQYQAENGSLKIGTSEGNSPSQYSKLRIYLHGFDLNEVQVDGQLHPVAYEDYTFLDKLSEFDPLPERQHAFHRISSLPFIELTHLPVETMITGLK